MTNHDLELEKRYETPGRFLPLFIDGKYPRDEVFARARDHRMAEATHRDVSVFNLMDENPIYYVGPDGVLIENAMNQHLTINDWARRQLTESEWHATHAITADFNHKKGVLIRVSHRTSRIYEADHLKPDFETVDFSKIAEIRTHNSNVMDAYIHVTQEELLASPDGLYIPQVGITVGLYRDILTNKALGHRELFDVDNDAPTGWFLTMDAEAQSYSKLWYKWTGEFEEIYNTGRHKVNPSNLIKVYRVSNGKPKMVASANIDDALFEGIRFTYNGIERHIPFFRNKEEMLTYMNDVKIEQEQPFYDKLHKLKEEIKAAHEKLKRAEERAYKLEQRAQKAESKAQQYEQKMTEQKESLWTRIVNFVTSTVPGFLRLAPLFL